MRKVIGLTMLLILLAGTVAIGREKTIAERKVDLQSAELALVQAGGALAKQALELAKQGDIAAIQGLVVPNTALTVVAQAWEEEAKAIWIAEPTDENMLMWLSTRLTTDVFYTVTYFFSDPMGHIDTSGTIVKIGEANIAVLGLIRNEPVSEPSIRYDWQ